MRQRDGQGGHERRSWALSFALAATLLGSILLVVAGCAPDDPSLPFLRSQPENDLAYPGASVVSTTTAADTFPVNTCCIVDRTFRVSATADDIGAWYKRELARRGWSYGGPPYHNGGLDTEYSWGKAALSLYLTIPVATGQATSYTISIQSPSGAYKFVAECEALRQVPEVVLAPPGVTRADGGPGCSIGGYEVGGGSRAGTVGVEQVYSPPPPMADALAFWGAALRSRGWTPVAISPMDIRFVVAKWAKWPLVALLETDSFLNTTTFGVWETLDASGSPVPLASELVPRPAPGTPDMNAAP